ncbi:MAG: hypothetical protein PHI91_02270 [Candidatus Pacebacteria bacterium]|nr:hypothetical protein [Candidatus Paceibacterota bacterium]MDD2757236.1 hypothetical protein [Candidatus Paceibacterota bacterium]MDD3283788.1 hypothetical protein [Candidatus Paceibacterota bacterium]MDD3969994.1 hypothetical protein [Candidatus Paceibacterota bacterium]MDD4738255.1 hypothetical protein [Candidatus Paceibacterota bacterium]
MTIENIFEENTENIKSGIDVNSIAEEIHHFIISQPHPDIKYSGADAGIYNKINNAESFVKGLSDLNAFPALSPEAQRMVRENPQEVINKINELGLDKGNLEGLITLSDNMNQEEVVLEILNNNFQIDISPLDYMEIIQSYSPYIATGILGAAISVAIIYIWLNRKGKNADRSLDNKSSIFEEVKKDLNEEEVLVYNEIIDSLNASLDRIEDDIDGCDPLIEKIMSNKPGLMSYDFFKNKINSKNYLRRNRLSESLEEKDSSSINYCNLVDDVYDSYHGIVKLFNDLDLKPGIIDDFIVIGDNKIPISAMIMSKIQGWHIDYKEILSIKNMKESLNNSQREGYNSDLFESSFLSFSLDSKIVDRSHNQKELVFSELTELQKKEYFNLFYIIDALIILKLADIKSEVNSKE